MYKKKYRSGKYSRLVGTGKTEEQAIANLQLKTFQKKKRDLLNSLSIQELNALCSMLECSICNEEEFDEYCVAGDVWGFKTYKDTLDLERKLYSIAKLKEKIEGDKND
jgi:vacuolar-type H+-ATPase subunit B/Vma2